MNTEKLETIEKLVRELTSEEELEKVRQIIQDKVACGKCGHVFEWWQKMKGGRTLCPKCGAFHSKIQ